MPSRPASRRWFQSCMVKPTTLCPSARNMAATVEESTPPDMATAMVSVFSFYSWLDHFDWRAVPRRNLPQSRDGFGHKRQRNINIFFNCLLAQAEADAGPRLIRTQAHGDQHMRRLNRP